MPIPIFAASKIAGAIGIKGFIAIGMAIALAIAWIGWNRAAEARDKAEQSLALADARIVLLEADAALKETAATERAGDTARTAQMEKELIDEIRSVPDTRPDAVRVRLGCERLRRRAGGLGADLPAVCRSGGGSEAGSRP